MTGGISLQERTAQIERLRRDAEQIRGLLVNLRKIRELDSIPFDRDQVDLESLLRDLCDWASRQPEAESKQITYRPTLLRLSTIQGEEDLLFVALQNLVENALKYTDAGGQVEIGAVQEGAHVILEVTDDGAGIPEGEIEMIWERLYRGSNRGNRPGYGLGLPLARAIIHRHGGEIRVRSREGRGTSFTVRLPIAPATDSLL